MKPRRVIHTGTAPGGAALELAHEGGHYVIRIGGAPIMSSAMHGSEEATIAVCKEHVKSPAPHVLIGGLGMGFTLRAALDGFPRASIMVAELLPDIVRYNRGELGALTQNPLDDPRVELFEGNVRVPLMRGGWDAVVMDIDNGPEAFTTASNRSFYTPSGVRMMGEALTPEGVLLIWSAFSSPEFERVVRGVGLSVETRRVAARPGGKGPRHTLFVIRR